MKINHEKSSGGGKIKHPKLRGEWAELKFMTKATEQGLCVSKPWGEVSRYDFLVEYNGLVSRVQVKSTMFVDRGGYSCSTRGSNGPYEEGAFDFLAAYVIPEDEWYIIPAEKITGQGSIALYPKLERAKYRAYCEAWELFKGAGIVDKIQACADENVEWEAASAVPGF
jgi:hypothetical protein